jgi:hypothetical protein
LKDARHDSSPTASASSNTRQKKKVEKPFYLPNGHAYQHYSYGYGQWDRERTLVRAKAARKTKDNRPKKKCCNYEVLLLCKMKAATNT